MNEKLKQLTDEDMSEEAIEARAYAAQKFYKEHFDKKLQALFLEQLVRFAEEAPNVDEIRGVITGLQAIDKWFEGQIGIVLNKNKKEEPFEETTKNIPSVG